MILVIDIGNTNVKLGVFNSEGELIHSTRLSSSTHKTSDEYFLSIKDLFGQKGILISDVTGVILSSVNPALNYTFEHLISVYFAVKPMVVGSGIKTGLNIRYDNPKEVGADRIVNSVSAYHTYGGPCVIIDCGTATTFNVVSEKGEFLGGAISFGLKASADALCQKAAKLPKIELVRPEKVIGKSTITNMQSGIINGYVGMVEYMVKKLKAEIKAPQAKVIATGGLSEIVSSCSNVIDVVDRTLTLRGLYILYRMNAEAQKE
ncbi:MAG: type III pantothenate kinase [Clostridia bacterium]|nr:type III pantothenate kinase [Clostridia bacterium]